ncbi:RagB/SusD family nutrient uptake outer membrane protein [Pontibacter qinzhouensis]|uniref:RagB/SusD family nutrient uptake outer membrane protein n=1 Tax=Pontibacter qinzhouensis TaxID=2603253 RepID=UPI002102217A|nr:RagB/SusD family nutrient uptake outer membrane protein [Pontibacter qinzhouensis]
MIQINKFKLLPIMAAAFVVGLTSCDLDEYNPSGATADEIWSTPEGFVTNVNAAYSEQRSWYGKEDGIFMSETGTDLWFNRDKNTYAGQLTQYAGLNSLQGNPNRAAWNLVWPAINLCNAGINRIEDAGFTDEVQKNRRLGELKFLRAFYYWHVVETWGGVMLRTEETQGPLLTASRSPVEAFYSIIIEDLLEAEKFLPAQSGWGNEYSRASNKSAKGLLARAYLTRAAYATGGEKEEFLRLAAEKAKEVIDNKAALEVDLYATYAEMWDPRNNKRNREALYIVSNSAENPTLNYDLNVGNRLYQFWQTRYNGLPGLVQDLNYGFEGNRRLMPTLAFLDMFNEENDTRYEVSFQEAWIANSNYTWTAGDAATYDKDPSIVGRQIRAGIDTALYITKKQLTGERRKPFVALDRDSVYLPNNSIRNGNLYVNFRKFRDPDREFANTQSGFKDVIVMRLAEMYLIAAEAEFGLGRPDLAANYINVLRTRAAKPDKVAEMQVTSDMITLDFILDERARELAGEHLRWFDLKRTGKLVERVRRLNPDITQIQDHHVLRPIRQEELNALLNGEEFGQNPGYN